jgi:hypothetical protein
MQYIVKNGFDPKELLVVKTDNINVRAALLVRLHLCVRLLLKCCPVLVATPAFARVPTPCFCC